MLQEVLKKYFSVWQIFLFTILLFLLTFPKTEPVIETGLDPSYWNAFNYFFATNFETGSKIIFSYGPLGFLIQPLPFGDNLMTGFLIISFLRLTFFFLAFHYAVNVLKKTWTETFFILLLLGLFLSLSLLIPSLLLLSLLLSRETGKLFFAGAGSLLVPLGLLIKINIGIVSGLIFFSYLVLEAVYYRRLFSVLYTSVISLLGFLTLWLITNGSINGIPNYLTGIIYLASGNSNATSINPDNNWWILGVFITLFIALPFIFKERNFRYLYAICFLAFFAMWKYAFAREENAHIKAFYDFFLVFSLLTLIVLHKIRPALLVCLFAMSMLFYRNMHLTGSFRMDDGLRLNGISQVSELIFDFEKYENKYLLLSKNQLVKDLLQDSVKKIIGKSTVDVYPWEITYALANKLNYHPRPILQNVGYTPWLDSVNAAHLSSTNAPIYMIWDREKWGGEVGGIDNKYLLSDEPQTIYTLLSRYKIIFPAWKIHLMKRTEKPRLGKPVIFKENSYHWNEWINIPDTACNRVIRARFHFERTTRGKIMNFLYKEMETRIEYKLKTGVVKKYRFVLDNAGNGIWIDPLMQEMNNEFFGEEVRAVRFIAADSAYYSATIRIEWEMIPVLQRKFVWKDDFEMKKKRSYDRDSTFAKSGRFCFRFRPQDEFGPAFSIPLSSLPRRQKLSRIIADTWFYSVEDSVNATFVVSLTDKDKVIDWHGQSVKSEFRSGKWYRYRLVYTAPEKLSGNELLKIYIWNPGKNSFYIDDSVIRIYCNQLR